VTTTIAEQVPAVRAKLSESIPADAFNAFASEQEGLRRDGLPDGAATPGSPLPDADLLDATGAPTTLTAARGGKTSVVVFYRGQWCPYCNLMLRTYQSALVPELEARGVRLIALSPLKPDGSLSIKEAHDLTFAVLSDPGNQIASKLGILSGPSPEAREAQLSLGLDLTEINADGTTTIPMPTVLIADADGTIRWIDIHPDYSSRTEVAEILTALDGLDS
jgi:peroxiredoxin